ncbi:MAG: hypothetical protein WAP03_12735 [Methylorubrum rhodinum]|uniref:hypothetical protein n=1 Tax=Methylorubrum rhodinum TaxID=29428 RepID=UPI003BAF72B2
MTEKPKSTRATDDGRSAAERAKVLQEVCKAVERNYDLPIEPMTEAATKPKVKPAKLGAEKLTPEAQKRRFIEAAQAAGAGEDEAAFDANLKRIARAKPPGS